MLRALHGAIWPNCEPDDVADQLQNGVYSPMADVEPPGRSCPCDRKLETGEWRAFTALFDQGNHEDERFADVVPTEPMSCQLVR